MAVDVDPLDRAGLADAGVAKLREAILEGRLQPGSKLGEAEVSQTLGVSRAPVREAFIRLEQEGLVTSTWHRGKSVVRLSGRDIEELVTLRSSLERLAWSRACRKVVDGYLTELETLVDQMRTAVGRQAYSQLVRLDIDFHDKVFLAADHSRLYTAWSAIKWQVALYLLGRRVLVDDYHEIIVAEHVQLIEELRTGEPGHAAEAVDRHIEAAYARLSNRSGVDKAQP